jgi:hypothetical protein
MESTPSANPPLADVYEDKSVHWFEGLRAFARRIVDTRIFVGLVLATIFATMISMTLYRPLDDKDSKRNKDLETAELVFNILFTIELVLKMMAMGPRLYFKDSFNHLDFVIVLFG